jgi:aspartate carbamoyltransferase catalytic subunit
MVAAEKFGMELYLCGPESLLPSKTSSSGRLASLDKVLPEVDALMMLRIQLERHESLELDAKTYHKQFGISLERITKMQRHAIVLHPGPFNRGVEISDEVVEHPQSRIFKQMSNGVFTRMAILEWAVSKE